MSATRARFALSAASLVLTLAARAAEPLDLIPADSLLCWNGQAFPDTKPADAPPSTIATLVDVGTRIAGKPLDARGQIVVRLFETLGLMIRYPHAIAVLDARARAMEGDPTARKVDQLRMLLVVKTGGKSEPFLRIVQKVVNEQTDAQAASLKLHKAGRWTYQELRDQRLPDWCLISWGQIDDCFVLSLGPDVWPLAARCAAGDSEPLAHDAWVNEARKARGGDATIEVIVAVRDIRERLDRFLEGRANEFFRAWHADDIDRAVWQLGLEGSGLFCEASFRHGDKTTRRMFADPHVSDPRLTAVIPSGAHYAVYRLPMGEMLRRFFGSLLATRGDDARKQWERTWERVQREHGLDVEHDLLAHLGEYWVLHTDPPHPLRLPLAVTTLIEIRDEPAKVRKTIDTICGAWESAQEKSADDDSLVGAATGMIRIHHDADGVWSLQFGLIAGPAWTVTDRFIVTSWSPAALRQYLAKASAAVK